MKVLITGASGFIGSMLAKRLLKEGFEIICSARSLNKLNRIPIQAKKTKLDITNNESIKKLLEEHKPEIVFHCAAETRSNSWRKLKKSNIEGTENLLSECLNAKIKKIIYLSSISVIAGNNDLFFTDALPYSALNNYGRSKIEAEKIAKHYRDKGLDIAILRPAMVYGEEDPYFISLLVDLIRKKLIPIAGNGKNRFPLVYIENLLDVMILSVFNEKAYANTYLIADKENIDFNELFGYIAKLCGLKEPHHLPGFFIPILTSLPFIGKGLKILFQDKVCRIDRLKNNLGYIPKVSFYDGIKRVVLAHKKDLEK